MVHLTSKTRKSKRNRKQTKRIKTENIKDLKSSDYYRCYTYKRMDNPNGFTHSLGRKSEFGQVSNKLWIGYNGLPLIKWDQQSQTTLIKPSAQSKGFWIQQTNRIDH